MPVSILVGELGDLLGFYLNEMVVEVKWFVGQESESDRFDLLCLQMSSPR